MNGRLREFLGYVGAEKNRWQKVGNGSESSARKSSASTVHHYYGALRAFFNWMVREGFVKETSLAKVRIPKAKQRVIQPYSLDAIKRVIQLCDNDCKDGAKFLGSRNRAIVLMLLDSGLRLSELTNIKIQDIDAEKGWIKVLGKGAKERIVRIGKAAQKALWRYLVYRGKSDYQEIWLSEVVVSQPN